MTAEAVRQTIARNLEDVDLPEGSVAVVNLKSMPVSIRLLYQRVEVGLCGHRPDDLVESYEHAQSQGPRPPHPAFKVNHKSPPLGIPRDSLKPHPALAAGLARGGCSVRCRGGYTPELWSEPVSPTQAARKRRGKSPA